MSGEHLWGDDWSVGLCAWVERAGRPVLGKGRLELLEGIDRHHSISAAARHMGMSYRHAWLLVQQVNEAAGEPLVDASVGGSHGGGARLTPHGRELVSLCRELQGQLTHTAAALLARLVQGPGVATVHVAAAVSLQEVLEQLLADYALRRPAVRVRAVFGASDELADQLLAGAPGDLLLSAAPDPLDRLEAVGLVQPGTRVVLAENGLAAIGPAERDVAVRRPADLAGVGRIALADPTSPLGGYCRAYLEVRGLYAALLPRAILVDNSQAVLAAIRSGQADVGLAYASDAGRAEGCRVLFRVRRAPALIRYAGAVVSRGQQADQARALLDFLASPAAAGRFRRCGFLPAR